MRSLFLVALLAFIFFDSVRAEKVEIWSYAFVTRTTELISGHGQAIFKPDGAAMAGPMWSHQRLPFEISFALSGTHAEATLTAKRGRNRSVTLSGVVTQTADDEGCLTRIVLTSEVHFVVLERGTVVPCET